jgi:hypothetical protein
MAVACASEPNHPWLLIARADAKRNYWGHTSANTTFLVGEWKVRTLELEKREDPTAFVTIFCRPILQR